MQPSSSQHDSVTECAGDELAMNAQLRAKEGLMEKSSVEGTGRMAAMAGAFAGTSLLFTSVILGQTSPLDLSLRIALYCFAGTVPVAILALVTAYIKVDSVWFGVPFWASALGAVCGVIVTIWHMNRGAAVVFLVAGLLSLGGFCAFLTFVDP